MIGASVSERLDAALSEHKNSRLNLPSELKRLRAVGDAGAPEAVVFYAARILEGLAADAVERLTLKPSLSVYSNLESLDHFDLFTTPTRYWSHSLRRLGNASRHLHHEITECDSLLATLFAEHWVDWFLSRILRKPTAFRDRSPTSGVDAQMRELASHLEQAEQCDHDMTRIESMLKHPSFWVSPVFSSTLAEVLIRKGATIHEHADEVLRISLDRFAKDVRLRQLQGLSFSRQNRYAEAIRVLDALAAESSSDEETMGILAGVHKRRYLDDPENGEALGLAQKMYKAGWKASGSSNTYLGINAATTSLYLGRVADAERLAGDVERTLTKRIGSVAASPVLDVKIGYWELATLAESLLLQRKWQAAEEAYRKAFAVGAGRPGDIESTESQRSSILAAFRRSGVDAEKGDADLLERVSGQTAC
jgi:tetratricopeptide (TPR) repeat protein